MDKEYKQNKQTAFILLLLFGALLFYWLKAYITPFLGAVIAFLLLRTPMLYLVEKRKWNKAVASFLLIALTIVLVFIPIIFIVNFFINQLYSLIQNKNELINRFAHLQDYVNNKVNFKILSQENINLLVNKLSEVLPGLFSESVVIIGNLILMYFILYYMLVNYNIIGPTVRSFLPLSDKNIQMFEKELNQITISNVVAAPLLSFIQAAVSILGYQLLGIQNALIAGLLTGLFSFIPFIGSALVWLPLAVWQLSLGNSHQALFIVLFGAIVISNIDNVFRFILQKKLANVHPLITVFGVLFGVPVFGIPGFIFGPLMLSYFMIGLRLYKISYNSNTKNKIFGN
jgi:predicted PurR-regulated permease PerM